MKMNYLARLACIFVAFLPGANPETLADGVRIVLRTIESIDAGVAQVGATYRASVELPISVNGNIVVPAGSEALLQVVTTSPGDVSSLSNDVALKLASLTVDGRTFNINTDVESLVSTPADPTSSSRGGNRALPAKVKGAAIELPANTVLAFTLHHDVPL